MSVIHQSVKKTGAPLLTRAMGQGLACIFVVLGVLWGWASATYADAAPAVLLEELHYRVNILMWRDALRARVTLKRLANDHYQAELESQPQGTWKHLQGEHRDRFQTEMVWREGRLIPVVYQEQCLQRGKKHLKEYRFDYAHDRLELWQWKEGKGLVRKWEGQLTGAIYDPLTAFYNCRLERLGPLLEGSTLKIKGIPYPKTEEIEVHINGKTQEGQKAIITIFDPSFHGGQREVTAFFNNQQVPTQAYMTIFGVGKISGELLPDSKPLKNSLVANPPQ